MKKIVKILVHILVFLIVIPLLAGFATTALWNHILTSACGFAVINLWQGIGIFILGQILSSGFILGCLFVVGSIHHIMDKSRGNLRSHWHNMTEEERKAFIERRATFGFRHNHQKDGNATE